VLGGPGRGRRARRRLRARGLGRGGGRGPAAGQGGGARPLRGRGLAGDACGRPRRPGVRGRRASTGPPHRAIMLAPDGAPPRHGRALAERGDVRGAMQAYRDALKDLHAVKPQRMRDVLLAQVYLSRYVIGRDADPRRAESDLRIGYSYARTTHEPHVRQLAEELWRERVAERERG